MGDPGSALWSIERPDARVSVRYRGGDVEVMVVEIGARGALEDSALCRASSWHFVVKGQAVFQQGAQRWELLPEEGLSLEGPTPFTIVNPSPQRLKLVSVVVAAAKAEAEAV